MQKVVIAIGGNALGNSPEEQKQIVKKTSKNIVDIIESGNKVIIVHGNGPQIGVINNSFEDANKFNKNNPQMDFPECGSMSQGYIGFHLQNAIANEFRIRNIKKNVCTIVTQVLVDKNDKAFLNPSKPIGGFYNEVEAKKLIKEKGWEMKEDSGRGFRRVIASPKPIDIIEKEAIIDLFQNDFVPIVAGGGGIPVYLENNILIGIPAVIDKDFAATKVAELVKADKLIILTAVDNVMINFGNENQQVIESISIKEAEKYIIENQFGAGSMLPKVEAALIFTKNTKNISIIGSLDKAKEVIENKSGTRFLYE